MRRSKHTAVLSLLLAGTLCGCGGARPTKYYVLDAPAATPSSQSTTQFPISLVIARPITSHLYRDDRIVFGSGPVELGTYEYERWAQSPADMIQDMLVNSLRSTGQYRSVLRPGTNAKGDYIVRAYLRSMYEVDRPDLLARFSIRLDLYDPKAGSTVWGANYSHDEAVAGKSVAAVVEALEKNVRAGMQELTSGLGQYFTDHPPKQGAVQ
jgi:ABC-type uncharacterized transport system auxiliary subunit